MFTIDLDFSELPKLLAFTNPAKYERSIYGALKKAGQSVKPAAGKEMAARYNLGSTRWKSQIKDPRIGGRSVSIAFNKGKPPTARAFGGRPVRSNKGLRVSFEKGSRKTYGNSVFWLNTNNGSLPMIRYGNSRGSVRSFGGHSAASIFLGKAGRSDEIRDAVARRTEEQFRKGIRDELKRIARGR